MTTVATVTTVTTVTTRTTQATQSYDELIEVQKGLLAGHEVPAHFLWRGKLWAVREVLSHWVEIGSRREQSGVAAPFGAAPESRHCAVPQGRASRRLVSGRDASGEREFWRVEAKRGRAVLGAGIFDLCCDWATGQWLLVRSIG